MHLDNKRKNTLWRLHTSLMNDRVCKEHIKEELKEYLQKYDSGAVSPNVLWDACKAVLRGKQPTGKRRSINAYQKCSQNWRTWNLENQHSTQQVCAQLKCIKQDINQIYDEQNEKKMRFMKQKYYETGPKAMKLLSWRLRKQQAERTVF